MLKTELEAEVLMLFSSCAASSAVLPMVAFTSLSCLSTEEKFFTPAAPMAAIGTEMGFVMLPPTFAMLSPVCWTLFHAFCASFVPLESSAMLA